MESLFQAQLEELHDKNLYRTLRRLKPLKGNRCLLDGREVTLFCGNDYLGLSRHPEVIGALQESAASHGAGAGAARLVSGSTDLHDALERRIASFKLKPKALVYSAGYLANLGVLSALAGEKDLILMDKLCHASLIDGARLSGAGLRVFPHKNYRKCGEILERSGQYARRLIVTDSVFSMDGDLADLEQLVKLKEKYDCLLVVDDAHATGVLGAGGRGAYEDSGLGARIDIITGTLSKAAGCLGGFAAASEILIDTLINFSRPFIYATALPAPLCAAALTSLRLMEEEPVLRGQLRENIRLFEKGLRDRGFETEGAGMSPIFPVVLGEERAALEASALLFDRGFWVPAIRYPTVAKGKARLRFTVNSLHERADIESVLEALLWNKKRVISRGI